MRNWLSQARVQVWLWACLVLALTLTPGDLLPRAPDWADLLSWDKLAHVFLFAVQSFLIAKALFQAKYAINKNAAAITAALLGMVFGLMIELTQYLLPIGRSGNIFDFMADVTGAVIAALFFLRTVRFIK